MLHCGWDSSPSIYTMPQQVPPTKQMKSAHTISLCMPRYVCIRIRTLGLVAGVGVSSPRIHPFLPGRLGILRPMRVLHLIRLQTHSLFFVFVLVIVCDWYSIGSLIRLRDLRLEAERCSSVPILYPRAGLAYFGLASLAILFSRLEACFGISAKRADLPICRAGYPSSVGFIISVNGARFHDLSDFHCVASPKVRHYRIAPADCTGRTCQVEHR